MNPAAFFSAKYRGVPVNFPPGGKLIFLRVRKCPIWGGNSKNRAENIGASAKFPAIYQLAGAQNQLVEEWLQLDAV